MNGGQDLGGMMGFGPIAPEADEPIFHAEWEKRALGVTLAASGCGFWGLDEGRHARETIPPAQYLSKSYYDIWITATEKLVVRHGMISPEELAAGHAAGPGRPAPRKLEAARVPAVLASGTPYNRPVNAPAAFAAGDRVRTRVMNPSTHTRLPRYARGKTGVVQSIHGAHVYPDTNAHGGGENPQWLYTVRFTARELWGPDADPRSSVSIDAFEPYLEPA